jgi:hypothetical protein
MPQTKLVLVRKIANALFACLAVSGCGMAKVARETGKRSTNTAALPAISKANRLVNLRSLERPDRSIFGAGFQPIRLMHYAFLCRDLRIQRDNLTLNLSETEQALTKALSEVPKRGLRGVYIALQNDAVWEQTHGTLVD